MFRMRGLLVGLVVLVVAVLVGAPYISWMGMADDPDGVQVGIEANAYSSGYAVKGVFSYAFTFENITKPGFTDYLGEYWSGLLPGSALPDYPYVAILVQKGGDTSSREMWYEPYTYGTEFTWSGKYQASHGDVLRFQIQIVFAQSISTYASTTVVVP